ncbi:MAG TPA: hypothetical protein PLS67_09760, partial [Accumulibacter sp.]|nr:hypothetical protein [Accumulibacter sp.]
MNIETWFNTEEIKRFYFPGRIFVGPGVFSRAVVLCHETNGTVAVVIDKVVHDLSFVREALANLGSKLSKLMLVDGAPIAQD